MAAQKIRTTSRMSQESVNEIQFRAQRAKKLQSNKDSQTSLKTETKEDVANVDTSLKNPRKSSQTLLESENQTGTITEKSSTNEGRYSHNDDTDYELDDEERLL